MMDIFESKNISPMLIAQNVEMFEDDNYVYEMKWDGERCIAYLDPEKGTELRNKRQMVMQHKVPELDNIHKQVNARCILDGELLCVVNGKPNFEAIKNRSLTSNKYKIIMEAERHPASFIAFDCLYYHNKDITKLSLLERKKYLNTAVAQSEQIAVSRVFDCSQARDLFKIVQEQGMEGIVAKKKDSLYFQGARTKVWLKIKNLLDDDFVICGYIYKANNMISLVLGQYQNGALVYKGHVTLGVKGADFLRIKAQKKITNSPFSDTTSANQNAVWLEPTLVCTVSFMEKTKNGSLRQPVFKGLRGDKPPEDCLDM